MFRKPGYFTVLLFAGTLLVGIAPYAASAIRAVEFDTVAVDAGSVKEGQQVLARFRFRNQGRSTAAILSVTPACSVLASVVRGRTLARGEDGEVEVRIDTSGRQGLLAGTVDVTLKDPFERTILLSVTATVEREFFVESPIVDFGKIARKAPAQRELRIRPNRTEYRVLNARATDENFNARVESHHTNGIATVVVSARPQTQPGLKFGTIRITTSSPHMPQLIVPVRARVGDSR